MPKRTTGQIGASQPETNGSAQTSTSTPATAESPASSRIEATTTDVLSMPPAFRSQRTRAAGVQIAPGMYFASIDAISDWSATPYDVWIPSARRIHCQPSTNIR